MATRILVVDDSPTIRTVVSTILERRGYDPKVASDGEDAYEALAKGEVKADLVLVDFVMPRMNGFQFCRALRESATLASMPVVLMSAKSDRIRDQFVQQTGALDAITKPFDADTLVLVIENALRKANTNRAIAAPLSDVELLVDLDSQSHQPAAAASDFETRRIHIAQIVAQKLATITTHALSDRAETARIDTTVASLTTTLTERLSREAIMEILEVVRDLGPTSDETLLAGDLGVVPIGAILQLLQAENQTGILVCKGGHVEIRAAFRDGTIDLVQSSGAGDEFRLGRFFVEAGMLSKAEVEEVATSSSPNTARDGGPPLQALPLGMALLAAGKISTTDLKAALIRQSSELLYEVLRWRVGRFELRREPPSELAESARLGLPVASVVMEGFRRVDEWRLLEQALGSFDAVLSRDDAAFGALDVESLPTKERTVLDAVDGERTVRAIVSASQLSSFDACRILAQFLEARVLRRRPG